MSSILIVEDEPDIAEGLGEVLEDEGHEVKVAHDGEAAKAALETARFDLVITDIMMPKLDGARLLAWIRSQDSTGKVPVIVMSAAPIDKATRARASAHLAKPFELSTFMERVAAVLAKTSA
jgi:DNA-binding response OmpR family regulator